MSFSLHMAAFAVLPPLWRCRGGGVPVYAHTGARVLPGYKPANSVLTAATPLHCRRAETNRV